MGRRGARFSVTLTSLLTAVSIGASLALPPASAAFMGLTSGSVAYADGPVAMATIQRSEKSLYLPLASTMPRTLGVSEGETPNSLIPNPSCASDTTNWAAWQSTVQRDSTNRRTSAASCLVVRQTGEDYSIDTDPAPVQKPAMGATYAASAWVRTSTASGKPVQLIMRQRGGASATARSESTVVSLSSNWQKLQAVLTVDAPDRDDMDVYVAQFNAGAGDSFNVDSMIVELQQAAPTTGSGPANPVVSTRPSQPPAAGNLGAPTVSSPATGGANNSVRQSISLLNLQTWSAPLFATNSAWNTPVSANTMIDPNSSSMIAKLANSADSGGFWLTSALHGPSMWYADSSTALVQVNADSRKWWKGFQAPIPATAKPSEGPDGHMVVWQVESGKLYEFWELRKVNGVWTAGYGVTFDASGLGYQTTPGANSARAAGVSLMGGVIRYDELLKGQINHALAMVYPYTRGKQYAMGMGPGGVMGIGSHSDNSTDPDRQGVANIPEGGRLRLKPSVDIDAKCAGIVSCKPIAQALKGYGAYVIDTGPDTLFYLENLQGKEASFDGLLDRRALRNFKASDFEVLALPALTNYP